MLVRLLALLLALAVPASAATRLNVAIGADVNVVEVHKTLLGPGFKVQAPDIDVNVVGTGTGEPASRAIYTKIKAQADAGRTPWDIDVVLQTDHASMPLTTVGHERSKELTEVAVPGSTWTFVWRFDGRDLGRTTVSDDDLRRIAGLLVENLNQHLVDRRLKIEVLPEVIDWIIEITCRDRSYGARPLRRAIQRYIEDPLSEELIRGELRANVVEIYLDHGTLAWRAAGQTDAGRKLAVTV